MSDDACQWNGYDVVISTWDFLYIYRSLCMLHGTRRKAEHSVTLQQRFPPLCKRLLFVVNTLTVFLSFCYIECELFAVFIKILFDKYEGASASLLSFMCLWNVPGVWDIWTPEWTLVWDIWTAFWPRWWGIWTIIFKKVQCPGGCPGDVKASIWPIHKFPICVHAMSATS